MINAAKAPTKKVEERLAALEEKAQAHQGYFASDKSRLDAIEKGNQVMQKALLALLAHGIDGNDVAAMRTAKTELQEYLINH